MPFRFRLQKVLDLRQRKVDAASREVAAAALRTATAARGIAELDAAVAGARESGAVDRPDFPVIDRIVLHRWLTVQADRRAGLCVEWSRLQAEEDDRRAEMKKAWQEVEILRKLRDRQREQWRQAQAKRESVEMDEIGVMRADRQRREKRAIAAAQSADERAAD